MPVNANRLNRSSPPSVAQRVATLPQTGLPLQRPVSIRWNLHQIPFIEADTDTDLATAFGLVHVHLRWTQMELMRRIAQGRVSEMIGPLGLPLDRALRTLDFTRAVPAMAAALPEETRIWLDAYLAGVNHAIAHNPLPPDFRTLGLERDPWTLNELLALGRLASADATWMVWFALLPHHTDPVLRGLWGRLRGTPIPPGSTLDVTPTERVGTILSHVTRRASNALAVMPSRSRTGAAWLAGDTHLPALLPNLWLLAGCRAPSLHAAGLMVPGVAAILIGRTPYIAWGGTNLHAASSDLFDVSDLPPEAITTRRETVRIRGWRPRCIAIRETEYGPIISDLRRFRRLRRTIALRWMGHQPSDEISALLAVGRARTFQQFRNALNLFAVPGQNFLYADGDGHIGKTMAVHLPARRNPPDSLLLPRCAAEAWHDTITCTDLPAQLDPPEGFLASANDPPGATKVPIGWFFSSRRRIERLTELLRQAPAIGFSELAAIQRDTMLPFAGAARDRVVRLLGSHAPEELRQALTGWDLHYEPNSKGALAFELILYYLGVALHGRHRLRVYSATWDARGLLFADLAERSDHIIAAALRKAVPRAARALRQFGSWGRMHRLDLAHFLASVPVLGRRYRFAKAPAPGGSDTLLKSGNPLTDRPHRSHLVSTARHISDLSDPDANWFVLLGGQDGWLGSTTLLDQTELFRTGAYIRMPLRPETVRSEFPILTALTP